jgi:hypothetical protein
MRAMRRRAVRVRNWPSEDWWWCCCCRRTGAVEDAVDSAEVESVGEGGGDSSSTGAGADMTTHCRCMRRNVSSCHRFCCCCCNTSRGGRLLA